MLQEARGLVPDGVRVLLVEAELKLMEAKYRGVRAGERWQAHHMLIVSDLRADTNGELMSVIEADLMSEVAPGSYPKSQRIKIHRSGVRTGPLVQISVKSAAEIGPLPLDLGHSIWK